MSRSSTAGLCALARADEDLPAGDVRFLSPDVAPIRGELVRTGQRTGTGAVLADRHIDHLRVLPTRDGRWVSVSHRISQATVQGSR